MSAACQAATRAPGARPSDSHHFIRRRSSATATTTRSPCGSTSRCRAATIRTLCNASSGQGTSLRRPGVGWRVVRRRCGPWVCTASRGTMLERSKRKLIGGVNDVVLRTRQGWTLPRNWNLFTGDRTSMPTSKKVASKAAKELARKTSSKEERSVAGAALAEAKKSKKK